MIRIASGVDHERVSAKNQDWDEFDWCRYWELDARKGYKKAGIPDPGRRMDCDDSRCLCRKMK